MKASQQKCLLLICSTLLRESPVRCPLLLCSSGLSRFPNSDVNSTRDFLIHSSERRCSYKSQSRDLFGREESRVWLLLQGWKGAAANWRSMTHIGLLGARALLRRFRRQELIRFKCLGWTSSEMSWILCSGIGWFWAQRDKGRLHFFSSGLKAEAHFCHCLFWCLTVFSLWYCIFH